MVIDHRPARNLSLATGRPVGEDLSVEGDFAVHGNLVYCNMQVTGLQYALHLSIACIGNRSVVATDHSTME